jgi:aconitate hydratase
MQSSGKDSPNTRCTLSVQGHDYEYFSLPAASDILGDISRLPMSLKVRLENILRHEEGRADEVDDARAIADWLERVTRPKRCRSGLRAF